MMSRAIGPARGRRMGWASFFACAALAVALIFSTGVSNAADKPHVKIAVGGPACLCYLPTVLAAQLGFYEENGIDAELISLKGGSQALTAVLGGSADVVSGYYDHTVNLAPKGKFLEAFVVYDRFPGLVLVVSPKSTEQIKTVADLVGQNVGVSAPGSSTDFFLKYALSKANIDPSKVPVLGVGLDATAVAAMEQGQVQAAVMLDPAVTQLMGRSKDVRILIDTRTEADTRKVFGGDYPGGAIYGLANWVKDHGAEAQMLTNAIVETLQWIHAHTAEEIAAKMPKEYVGEDRALYIAALKNTIPMYSVNGLMDAKGAEAVLAVFSQSNPEVAAAHVDVTKTYTNVFAEKAGAKFGVRTN